MKTLILCRHAKSDWPDGVPDSKRPLKERGIKDAHRQGKFLKERKVEVDQLFSSHAQRALETAKIIADELAFERAILQEPSIYHEGAGNLLSFVQDLPDSLDSVMIFGHNPTLEQVVQFLAQTDRTIGMPTCALACFEFGISSWDAISPHNAHLRWLIIPRLWRKVL